MSRARDFADLASANASGSLVSPNLVDNGMMAIYQRGIAVITEKITEEIFCIII